MIGILDWGLGHACRSIPIVHYLRQFQCQIFIAATGSQKKLLEQEFPDLTYLDPPAYDIEYPEGRHLVLGLLKQFPRLYKVARKENRWVEKLNTELKFNLIISDNRYGFRSKEVFSVFITHQLAPISGFGPQIDNLINLFHIQLIDQFDECWVPDTSENGLSGKLSHPRHLPKKLSFIGPLSRFESSSKKIEKKDFLLVILSGPEPSRSVFEEKLLLQLEAYTGEYVLIRGLPGETGNNNPRIYNHEPASHLKVLIEEAAMIICRAGYTSIMDLVALSKTAVLVPTPGQTEQEYLANHLAEKQYFLSGSQDNFVLEDQVRRLKNFRPVRATLNFQAYTIVIREILNKLNPSD